MNNPLENDQPKIKEVKHHDERFHSFDPREMPHLMRIKHGGLNTEIEVDTGILDLPKIPISISALDNNSHIKDLLSPFSPKDGYQIDADDLKLETRVKKDKDPKYSGYIDRSKIPLVLSIRSGTTQLEKAGLAKKQGLGTTINPEFLPLIRRLRVQVFFPSSPPDVAPDDPNFHSASSYEARPRPLFLNSTMPDINFLDFYPLETGPLPTTDPDDENLLKSHLDQGFGLQLPLDLEKLKQIEIKFIILPEQKTDIPDPF